MPTDRWFFRSDRRHKDDEVFVYEGDPEDIPTFQGWVTTRTRAGTKKTRVLGVSKPIYKEPTCLYKGILYVGRLLNSGLGGGPCTPNCRKALKEFCRCSCRGKNHGIENRDMANAIQEEDVIYIG